MSSVDIAILELEIKRLQDQQNNAAILLFDREIGHKNNCNWKKGGRACNCGLAGLKTLIMSMKKESQLRNSKKGDDHG